MNSVTNYEGKMVRHQKIYVWATPSAHPGRQAWTTQADRPGALSWPPCPTLPVPFLGPALCSVTLSVCTKSETTVHAPVSSFYIQALFKGASRPVFKFSVVRGWFLYLPKLQPSFPLNRHHGSTDVVGLLGRFLMK